MTRRTVFATAASVTLLLTACSDDESPSPPPTWDVVEQVDATTTATESPDSDVATETAPESAAPTTDGEPTTDAPEEATDETGSVTLPEPTKVAPDDLPTEPPPEALADSNEGVTAFARYYIDVWNRAALTGDTTEMRELSGDDCDFCDRIMRGIDDLAADGITADDTSMVVTLTSTTYDADDGGYLTRLHFIDGGYSYVDADGTVELGPLDLNEIALELVVVESQGSGKQVSTARRVEL